MVLDKATSSKGLMVSTDKRELKVAALQLMCQLRLPCFIGIATNLYQWQLVYYSRTLELQNNLNFFRYHKGVR